MADERQRINLMRFFRTGPGQYGEGDEFLGIKVPFTRKVVKEARLQVPLEEIEQLLYSKWHEVRLCGFLLLAEEMRAALPAKRKDPVGQAVRRKNIAEMYLRNARQANNWDLVDLSCYAILGQWLMHPLADGSMPDRSILDRLAVSDNLWEQRISIVTTLAFIRADELDDTFRISDLLLSHPHDLIHKAVGWMLREAGKRDARRLRLYLKERYASLNRTTLRYAIERFSQTERKAWLAGLNQGIVSTVMPKL